MSVKRVVNIAFWTDWKIEGFSAAERYFYLYLLTGPCSTQLGIYETSIRQMAFHLGYTEARVRALLEKFEREHKLTKAPLSIDLLIIRKMSDEVIDNELGNIFRKHNIWEMKSPDDEMSIDVFYKVQAYACLYKANSPKSDGIKVDNITVSLVHEGKPVKMSGAVC